MGCNTISSGTVDGFSVIATAETVKDSFLFDETKNWVTGVWNFDPKDKNDDDFKHGVCDFEILEVKLAWAMLLMWDVVAIVVKCVKMHAKHTVGVKDL